MSEGDQSKASTNEFVIRVVVEEREKGDNKELAEAVSSLASVALRMTEVVERLIVVGEEDAAIINTIHSFNERIGSLEKIVKLVEERIGIPPGSLARLNQGQLGEALEYLEGELDKRINDAIAQAAFTATQSTSSPHSIEITTIPSTVTSSPEVVVASKDTRVLREDEQDIEAAKIVQEPEELAGPEYTRIDKSLSIVNARVELILLFLLAQPDCRYVSIDNNAYTEMKEAINLPKGDSNWGNALATLRYKGITWTEKINVKRVREIGISKEALQEVLNEKFITQRVRDAFNRADFSHEAVQVSRTENEKYELDPFERDVILVLGEVETAIFTESLEEKLAERYGKPATNYEVAIKQLLGRDFIRMNKYGDLKEFRLSPKGKLCLDAIIASEQEFSEDPPFLAIAQAS